MNQVCVMAKLARVGWDGFNNPPPSEDDVLKAIESMEPSYKQILGVLFFI